MHHPANQQHFHLLSVAFEDKRLSVPLQAADILAWELSRQTPKQLGLDSNPLRLPRPFSLRSLASVPGDWGHSDAVEIAKWSQIISIRTRLAKEELWRLEVPKQSGRPKKSISIEEFQERWRWWNQFRGLRP